LPAEFYAVPVFARGTGLGNRLFQWARCRSWSYEHGATLISPRWLRLGLGPLLRRTVRLDQLPGRIALMGQFVAHPDDLSWAQALPLRFCCHSSHERCDPRWLDPQQMRNAPGGLLRLFDGRDDSFTRLNRHQRRLRADFEQIIAPRHRQRVDRLAIAPIGLNIRLGNDFAPPPTTGGYGWVGWLQQTPLSWFVETLLLIRERAGWPVPAVVVSDGTATQLEPLLALPAVTWLARSNTVVDLLCLSRTRLLLGSGSSSFSAWAAFLGQQAAFTAPGHPFTRLDLQPLQGQAIGGFDPTSPDPQALAQMVNSVCA
jgi:hypothetical protein